MNGAHDESIDALHPADETRPRVVYTQAPVLLAKLLAHRGDAWRVSLGGTERDLSAEPEVDVALLVETLERSGRVLVETSRSGEPTIVGVVQTQRAITISPEGEVSVEVDRFRVRAEREILLSSPRAFLRIQRQNLELYGGEVLTRAREVVKILGRLISLN